MAHLLPLLAAVSWDPTVRGALIVMTGIGILVGSVFLLLSTNVGARLAFLLTMCGLFGWLTCQGLVWTIYAQGNKGELPHWNTREVITGDLEDSVEPRVRRLPQGWEKLDTSDKIFGDAVAAADHVLVTPKPKPGHEGEVEELDFPHMFDENTKYMVLAVYDTGGEKFPRIPGAPKSWDFISVKHKPHYAVVQVQPVVLDADGKPPLNPDRSPAKPRADTSQSKVNVVMVRDLGSVRRPPAMLMVSSGIVFGVLLYVLHRRDKEIMAARAAEAVG